MKVRIDGPCDVSVSAMQPREGGHHCGACDRLVLDLRAASEDDVRAIVAETGGRFCARILPDRAGLARLRPAGLAVGAAMLAATLGGCGERDATATPPGETQDRRDPDGTDHDAHPGELHTEGHTEEYGLAGEAVAWDPSDVEPSEPEPIPSDPEGPAVPEEAP